MQRHTERQLVRVMNCCTLRRTKPGGSNHRQPGLCGLSRYSSNDHRLTSMQSLETESCGLVATGLHRFRTPCFSPAGHKPPTSWPLLSPSDLMSSLWSHWRCEGLTHSTNPAQASPGTSLCHSCTKNSKASSLQADALDSTLRQSSFDGHSCTKLLQFKTEQPLRYSQKITGHSRHRRAVPKS